MHNEDHNLVNLITFAVACRTVHFIFFDAIKVAICPSHFSNFEQYEEQKTI